MSDLRYLVSYSDWAGRERAVGVQRVDARVVLGLPAGPSPDAAAWPASGGEDTAKTSPQPGRSTAARPTPRIDIDKLTVEQHAGMACVVCAHAFGGTEHPVAVGYLGGDHHNVYACPRPCARGLDQLVTDNRPRHALIEPAVQWPA